MTRFLLINTTISWNKGSAAQVAGMRDAVRTIDQDAQFTLLSYCKTLDKEFEKHYEVSVAGYDDDRGNSLGQGLRAYVFRTIVALLVSLMIRVAMELHLHPNALEREEFCRTILDSDVVVDLSGDSLSDRGSHSLVNLVGILLCVLLGKPVVCYSQSIGPFSKWTKALARIILSRVETITVREQTSYDYLMKIGLSPERIAIFADCAFTLSAADETRACNILLQSGIRLTGERTLVGLSVSSLMAELEAPRKDDSCSNVIPYTDLVEAIADTIREVDPGAMILLVPHVIAPRHWTRDDRWISERLIKRMSNPDNVHTLSSDYTAEELKGVIGQCSFFVGSRMHACIAALSQCVPTVAISWSHKYAGIMDRLGMESLVFDATNNSLEETISGVRDAFISRDVISGVLAAVVETEKTSAMDGAATILHAVGQGSIAPAHDSVGG